MSIPFHLQSDDPWEQDLLLLRDRTKFSGQLTFDGEGINGEYEIDLTAEDQRDYYYCPDAVIEMLCRQCIEDCGEQPESWHIRISPWGQMLVTPGMVDKSKWKFSTHPGDPDPVRAS